jgi:phosphoglycolate phosphatase
MLPFARSTAFAGILFDKDGTLIDFPLTWGPAVYAVIRALAAGDPTLIKAQAEALDFSIEDQRFLSSPPVAGSTADSGRRRSGARTSRS